MIEALFIALFQAAAGDPAVADPEAAPVAPVEEAQAAPAPEAATPAPAQQADARHQRRCWTEPVTGSRFGRRVCTTPAQDEQRERNTRDMMHDLQRASPGAPAG